MDVCPKKNLLPDTTLHIQNRKYTQEPLSFLLVGSAGSHIELDPQVHQSLKS